ncbi:MAG: hypothetical protein Q8R92_10430, partial [Deltaproteobacteria bacterium]|nr:hypothetical protein [Deltaproteobacteria bacterium]
VRRGQVAHPGLHRGWFKHQPMHRRNAVRHNQNGFPTYGTPSHRHPGYWRQSDSDSRHDRNDNFDRRHDGNKQMKNQDHKNNNKNDNTRDHDGNSNRHARRHGG